MFLGQTNKMVDEAQIKKFTDKVTINVGRNQHRVLTGPFLQRVVYWPSLEQDSTTGEMKQVAKMVNVPKEGSQIFDALSSIEKEIRATMGEKEPRSKFKPNNQYLYLIFNREEEEPIVRAASYKWTIFNRLDQIQKQISSKDKNMLAHGLIFMYDIIITKTVGDPNRAQYTTKYSVDPDVESNPFLGSVPVEFLKYSEAQIMETLSEEAQEGKTYLEMIFTPEELKAIEECDIDLTKEINPLSDDKILAKITESPIYFGAKDQNGHYMFPQEEHFMKAMKSMDIKLIESESVDDQKATDSSKTTEVKEEVKEEEPKKLGGIKKEPEGSSPTIKKWGGK